jgi:hypothetical protein
VKGIFILFIVITYFSLLKLVLWAEVAEYCSSGENVLFIDTKKFFFTQGNFLLIHSLFKIKTMCYCIFTVYAHVLHFGWDTVLQSWRSRVWFSIRSVEFSVDWILPATLWFCCSLSLRQKWVPGIFVRCRASTT